MKARSSKAKRLFVCLVAVALAFNTVFVASAFQASADNTVLLGQACCDEKGGVKGGKAGDQTGREAVIGNWSYNASRGAFNHWQYVFRAKNPKTAKKLAKRMKEACENDHVGYDQKIPDRYSFYYQAEKVNWNIKAIKKNCETTCTSAISVCLNAVGIPMDKFWTVNHVYNDLVNSGQFMVLTSKKYTASSKYLEPGDILLSSCHGAMVVGSTNTPGTTSPGSVSTATAPVQEYEVGKNYQLTTHLYVREGPGKEYTVKFRSDLTADAKKYAEEGSFAILNQGTVVTCLESKNGWIKIPSGWICGTLHGDAFVEEYTGTDEQKAAYEEAKNKPKTTKTTKKKSTSSTASKTTSTKKTTATKKTTKKTTTKKTTKKTTTKTTKKTTKKTTTKKTTKKKSTKLVIKPNRNYRLAKNLYVRTGPGTGYDVKSRWELTEDGRKHSANSSNAILKKGTEVTCLEVQGKWMRIPSGWVCCKKGNIKKK